MEVMSWSKINVVFLGTGAYFAGEKGLVQVKKRSDV